MERLVLSTVLFCSSLMFAATTIAEEIILKDGFDEPIVLLPTVIKTFLATPSTVEEGQLTTISWTTEDADFCTGTAPFDDFNGSVPTNGSVDLIIANAGSYDFTLTCHGDLDPAEQVMTIIVEEKTTTTNCDAPPLTGVIKQWGDFWKESFPGPGYENVDTVILRTGYMAIEFNTGDIVDNGLLVSVTTTLTRGIRTGTITECPGDFGAAPECSHAWGTGGGIEWATNGEDGACQLKPNTTYFFNITYTDGFDSQSSTCDSQVRTRECWTRLQHVNR